MSANAARFDREPSPGWVQLFCRNHPSYRWTMKDPTIPRISSNTQLSFVGDSARPELYPWPSIDMPERASGTFVCECACPYGDLVIIR